ncbi:TerB family tellurite resistance protein [Seongchinamella sediminis]|uniref:TerB family tellurite resistance protein n=1 Tax=Seongchinamella sediminis TaxID=2283635 RepID=A0A3L7E120_9GAMM|nr:TerB family tellurite resistance protein [Seongchinamella sediminis]RLQ23206.1 TerB family tellurite resistance protein [Seongchinamella sediminis]
MIAALKALFEKPDAESEADLQHRLQLASAALLIETARADFTQDAAEQETMEALLCSSLKLDETEVRQLLARASERVDESISLYEFTRLINDHFSMEQKLQLVHNMWVVAWADNSVDKYEEHLIRQVAELTYVPHPDYIRSKHQARDKVLAL